MREEVILPSDCKLGTTVFHGPGFCGMSDLEAGVMAYAEMVGDTETSGMAVGDNPASCTWYIRARAYHLHHLPWFKAKGPGDILVAREAPVTNTKQALHAAAAVLLRWSRGD